MLRIVTKGVEGLKFDGNSKSNGNTYRAAFLSSSSLAKEVLDYSAEDSSPSHSETSNSEIDTSSERSAGSVQSSPSKPSTDRVSNEADEPLLRENPQRFVVYPIQYHDIWQVCLVVCERQIN